MKEGIVLFAHGSREPGWAHPFKKIRQQVQRRRPKAVVVLAYLERMDPDLRAAFYLLNAKGVQSVRIVPLFLGAGGHIKKDLPDLVGKRPGMRIRIERPIGEQRKVIEAIATAIAR